MNVASRLLESDVGSYVIGDRKMKRNAAVLIAFLVFGASVVYAQSEGESGSKPFHFSVFLIFPSTAATFR